MNRPLSLCLLDSIILSLIFPYIFFKSDNSNENKASKFILKERIRYNLNYINIFKYHLYILNKKQSHSAQSVSFKK